MNGFERRFQAAIMPPASPGEVRAIPADRLNWGDYIDLQAESDPPIEMEWSAFFRLAKFDGYTTQRFIDFDKLRAFDTAEGTSNFLIDPSMVEPLLSIPMIPTPLILRRGPNNSLAAIELASFRATGARDAMMLARTYFNICNAIFVFHFDVPLKFASAAVKRVDNTENHALRTYVPWSDFQLSPSQLVTPTGLSSRLMLMYAEGVMSSSPAYRFLCFFRIVDHVLRVGGARLRKLWKDGCAQATWIEFNDVLPVDPIQHYDLDLVGKKYTVARDRYERTELRNATAHVLATTAAFDPLDPEHAGHYRAAAAIFRFISHRLIRLVSVNSDTLLSNGMDAGQLQEAFYPVTTR